MSSNQSTRKQSRNTQTPKSWRSSLPRRLRSHIQYWTSSILNFREEGSNKDLDPQNLEAGLSQQNMPTSRTEDSQDVEDSSSTASNSTTFREEKTDNGIDFLTYTPPANYDASSAQKEKEQFYDNNAASQTADPLTQQPPEYTNEARHLIRSFTIGHHNVVSSEPRSVIADY